jgi:hypothetical protein
MGYAEVGPAHRANEFCDQKFSAHVVPPCLIFDVSHLILTFLPIAFATAQSSCVSVIMLLLLQKIFLQYPQIPDIEYLSHCLCHSLSEL